jgi:hypothetical protein
MALLSEAHIYGRARVAEASLPCGLCAVREEGGSDWLDLYFPLGGLCTEWGIGLPADLEQSANKGALDDVLIRAGAAVFAAVPFQLGLIGWEVSGYLCAADLANAAPKPVPGIIYLWAAEGQQRVLTA